MIKALYTSATGMRAQQQLVDLTANNLANVNTTGFKRSRMDFQDLLYDTQIMPGSEIASNLQIPSGLQIGSGVRSISSTKIFTPGFVYETGGELDMGIAGRGFFEISMPDGTTAYTRDGSFRTDSDGTVTTSEGLYLSPQITVASDRLSIAVGSDGTITVTKPDGTTENAGQITLTTFPNPTGLKSVGGNLYVETASSGSPQTSLTPGENGVGNIKQKYLERSNVEVVVELVNLITAQRAYEINSRAIRSSDDMLATVNGMTR